MGKRAAVAAVLVTGLALVCAPFAAAGQGFSPPSPTTPSGEAIKGLYWFVFAICAVVFVLVESALVLFIIRFRRRRTAAADAEGPQIHGNTRLEIIWTLIPALILVVIAVVVFVRVPAVEAEGDGGQRDPRRGAPVLLAVRVRGRSGLARPARSPGRPARAAPAHVVRRRPQLVGAGADRQAGRDPRPDDHPQLHAGEGGNLRREVRRALRRPARRDADGGRGRVAGAIRTVPLPAGPTRARETRSSSSAGRRSPPSAPTATGPRARATTGRRSRATGRSRTQRRSPSCSRTARTRRRLEGYMPGAGRGWPRLPARCADRLHRVERDARGPAAGGGTVVAVRAEVAAPTWREGRVMSWVTTVDHKRIGDPLHRHLVRVLLRGGDHGAPHARAARAG